MMEQLIQLCQRCEIRCIVVDGSDIQKRYIIYHSRDRILIINENTPDNSIKITIDLLIEKHRPTDGLLHID